MLRAKQSEMEEEKISSEVRTQESIDTPKTESRGRGSHDLLGQPRLRGGVQSVGLRRESRGGRGLPSHLRRRVYKTLTRPCQLNKTHGEDAVTDPHSLSLRSAEAEQHPCKPRCPNSNSPPPKGHRNPRLSGIVPLSLVAALSGGSAPSPLTSPVVAFGCSEMFTGSPRTL